MKRKLLYVSKSILALRSFATMLLFISAISVGWGTNYIHWGESGIGGWSDAELSGSGSTETTTITLTAEKNYEFVLKKGDNTWWKFNGTVEVKSGTEYSLSTSNGQNGKISNATGGTYTFTVKWDNNGNPTLTVTFPASSSTYTPVLENANEISCFFETPSSMTNVYAWIWSDNYNYSADKESANWNSDAAELDYKGLTESGKKIWKWTYNGSKTDSPTGIIFLKSRTNSDNDKINTTGLTFTNHGYYVYDGTNISSDVKVIETKYSVNISAGEGGTVNPEGEQQVGSTPVSITATPSDGYSFVNWTATSNGITIANANSASTTITATAAGSVTAVFTSSPTPSGGTYFLPGTWNNWSTSDETHKLTDGQTTLTLNPGTYSFKLYNGTWYGSTSSITGTSNINLSNTAGDISITIKEYGNYTFAVSETNGALQLTVTYPTVTKRFYLTGSVTSANSFSTMNEDFKIDPSKTTTIEIDGNDMGRYSDSGNSAFAIICDDETDWYMRPATGTPPMTMGKSYEISSDNTDSRNSLYFNSSNKENYTYIFTITISEGATSTATVMVQRIPKNSKSVYFVSPELTGSKRLEAFKMSSSRQRNGGDILPTRLSFNLQDFVLDAKASITYWFEDNSGNKYYPSEGNYEFDDHKSSNDYAGKGTTYATVTATYSTGTGEPSAKFKLTRGKAMSYTWLLDTSSKKVEYIGNPSYFGNTNEAGAYYLVGNFDNADATVDINPGSKANRKLMNRYCFKDGKAYTKEIADADSIVYRVTVPMPAKGWSQLYLAVFSKTDIDNWNGSDLTASWNKAIRPEEQWDYNNNSGLDGTALHGGLFAMGTKRADQAINPIVSDEYSSYTFSMNVTTSTYKLVFNSNKLYLMGPAVNDNDQTGWNSNETGNTYKMTYVQEEQCYKYLDDSGFEKPMQLYAGKQFAFVYNKDFTNVFYDEDAVVPVDLSGTIDAYATANNDKGNCDTQYVNFIKSATSNSSAYDSKNVNACTFNLPTGEYTLRLYIRTDPNNPEKTDIYYLIKDRQYPFYWPDADASKMMGYTTFRSFCDYHAVIIPGGIDVFTVDTPNKTNKTVKLTSYNLEDNRVLPANTPVLLAKKDVGTRNLTSYVTMEYYSVPNYTATSATTNLLHGQVSRYHIPVSNNNGTLNFLFGYKKLQGNAKVTVGFFTPGAGECSINTAYLTLDSGFWDDADQQNTKGFRLVFDDNNETTSVDEIQTVSDNAPAVYYNMQGVRVLNPGKGLYIRNGKKYIIR